eukprot:tig00000836_g4704.t1
MADAGPVDILRQYVRRKAKPPPSAAEADAEVETNIRKIFEKMKARQTEKDPTLAAIPRFFFKKNPGKSELQMQFRKEVKNRFLQRKSKELLDQEELENLYYLLKANVAPPEIQERINYEGFLKVGKEMGPKCADIFTAKVFMRFERDELGRIPIMSLFNYVMRTVSLSQTRICLSFYDSAGYGYLREQDMENYIFELIPSLPQLSSLEEIFYPFYVCTAVRKFFFFLDPMRKGHIKIKTLLFSPILAELFELRQEHMSEEEAAANWFSAQSALRVYEQYLALDEDHNGLLSQRELARYGQGTLTPAFVQRVFDEFNTYDGEMDYKTFLNFVLAMENKKSPQALRYFFRILDVRKLGYLTIFNVNYFFRDVIRCMRENNHDPVSVEDVKDEIFDMIKPAHPLHITLEDLMTCRVGDTIVSMLIDWMGFWMYDNRENLVSQEPEDGQGGGPA